MRCFTKRFFAKTAVDEVKDDVLVDRVANGGVKDRLGTERIRHAGDRSLSKPNRLSQFSDDSSASRKFPVQTVEKFSLQPIENKTRSVRERTAWFSLRFPTVAHASGYMTHDHSPSGF
jgi:hypothetical protein